MIQNDQQLAIANSEIRELEYKLAKAIFNRKTLGDNMMIASFENMLSQMRGEVREYMNKAQTQFDQQQNEASAPTEDEGIE